MDVVLDLDRLSMTVSMMDPAQTNIDRRRSVYFYDVWIQQVYNLCEKIKLLIRHTCRLHKPEGWTAMQSRYIEEVKSKVQSKIGYRSPIVHGDGGDGTLPQIVISGQDGGWEMLVIAGPAMINTLLEETYGYGPPTNALAQQTEYVISALGSILQEFEIEMDKSAR